MGRWTSLPCAASAGFMFRLFTYSVRKTVARKFGNLQAIRDNYPKYVISMDPVGSGLPEYPGIMHIHLREFLMTDF